MDNNIFMNVIVNGSNSLRASGNIHDQERLRLEISTGMCDPIYITREDIDVISIRLHRMFDIIEERADRLFHKVPLQRLNIGKCFDGLPPVEEELNFVGLKTLDGNQKTVSEVKEEFHKAAKLFSKNWWKILFK